MTNFYIGFPISFSCNLRCPYCFNAEYYSYIDRKEGINKWREQRPFSIEQYKDWRNKYLRSTDIIMHLFGGEPFCYQNIKDVFDILDKMDIEKFDLLSNGIANEDCYLGLKKYASKIHRIGFTYHRNVIEENDALVRKFDNNVMNVSKFISNVYVKELLFKENRGKILEFKEFWKRKGISFKIQDFKGMDRGMSRESYKEYTPVDNFLVDSEYKHYGRECSCKAGYQNLFIRGFDMADVYPNGGDVIACWYDPCVIGNIVENWFNSDYKINRVSKGIDVTGVPKIYRGTYEKDLYISKEK